MPIKYYLNYPKAKKDTSLMIDVNFNGIRCRASSGLKIHPKQWNKKTQRVSIKHPSSVVMNAYLSNLSDKINDFWIEKFLSGRLPAKSEILDRVEEFRNPAKEGKTKDGKSSYITDYFDLFLKSREDTNKFKTGTAKRIKVSLNHVRKYEKTLESKIKFSDINKVLADSLLNYLFNEANQVNRTAETVIRNLQTFFNWVKDNEEIEVNHLIFNKALKEYGVKRNTSKDTFALSIQELLQIQNADLKESKKHDKVRDLFLILCFTGLRYSDLKKLTPANINFDSGFIEIYAVKTDKRQLIPIIKPLETILRKYSNGLNAISNQKFNAYLKELAKAAKLDAEVNTVSFKGKQRIEKTAKKYELISSHTGRRTYATLLHTTGNVSLKDVQIALAHSSEQTTDGYMKVTEQEALNRVRKAMNGLF